MNGRARPENPGLDDWGVVSLLRSTGMEGICAGRTVPSSEMLSGSAPRPGVLGGGVDSTAPGELVLEGDEVEGFDRVV